MNSTQPWANIPPSGPLLRPKDAAAYLGYSTRWYYALAAKGDLPSPIRMADGKTAASAVPRPWLDAVIAARAAA